jgi:hypothetical protein
MSRWLTFWILGASLLTACSSTPVELPTCEIPAPMAEVGHPIGVPEMPVETSRTDDGATFDRAGVVQLTQLRVAAETNKRVAEENALAIEARNEEVNQLIECARYAGIWMEVREEMLEDQKQEHMMDNLMRNGLILLLAAGLAL